jgi:UDP-glucose 4-epimerase
MMKKSIIITGAEGLLGRAFINATASEYDVIKAVRQSTDKANEIDITGDISSKTWLDNAKQRLGSKKVFAIVHFAGQPTVWKAVKEPAHDAEANIISTINVLMLAEAIGVDKFVFSSSEAVYGEQEKPNEATPAAPVNPYGISKLSCEKYVQYFSSKVGFDTHIIRPSFILGAGLARNIVFDIITAIKCGKSEFKLGISAKSEFNFVDVKCVAETVLDIIKGDIQEPDLNIVGDKNYNVDELTKLITLTLNKSIVINTNETVNRTACLSSLYPMLYQKNQVKLKETLKVIVNGF